MMKIKRKKWYSSRRNVSKFITLSTVYRGICIVFKIFFYEGLILFVTVFILSAIASSHSHRCRIAAVSWTRSWVRTKHIRFAAQAQQARPYRVHNPARWRLTREVALVSTYRLLRMLSLMHLLPLQYTREPAEPMSCPHRDHISANYADLVRRFNDRKRRLLVSSLVRLSPRLSPSSSFSSFPQILRRSLLTADDEISPRAAYFRSQGAPKLNKKIINEVETRWDLSIVRCSIVDKFLPCALLTHNLPFSAFTFCAQQQQIYFIFFILITATVVSSQNWWNKIGKMFCSLK